jgi:hypothetical protein
MGPKKSLSSKRVVHERFTRVQKGSGGSGGFKKFRGFKKFKGSGLKVQAEL